MKSKDYKNKHDHKLTSILKAMIFSILMLAPFIAIAVKCFYVINNENAKDSYRGSYEYYTTMSLVKLMRNESTTQTTITTNNYTYYKNDNINFSNKYEAINYKPYYTGGLTYYNCFLANITNFTVNDTTYNYNCVVINPISGRLNIKLYNFTFNTTNYYINQTTNIIDIYDLYNNIVTPSLTLNYTENSNAINYSFINSETIIYTLATHTNFSGHGDLYANIFYTDTTLSSVFYSAVQELDKASIFSWTTNTGTYTAINNMCTTIGIVSPPLAVIMTYWTLLTVIYIIIDIVIETFTYLTHWFNDKMV